MSPNTPATPRRKRAAPAPSPATPAIATAERPAPEIWVPPSAETRFLMKYFRPLMCPPSPKDKPTMLQQWWFRVVVAPGTQLSMFSFDLNIFLFSVLHTSVMSRITHFGMLLVVFYMILLGTHGTRYASEYLSGSSPQQQPSEDSSMQFLAASGTTAHHPDPTQPMALCEGGTLFAMILAVWYLQVAISQGLHAWGALSVCVVCALWSAANTALASGHDWLWDVPACVVGTSAASLFIGLGHAWELPPPRFTGENYWGMSFIDYIRKDPAFFVCFQLISGPVSEAAASPRLMPYNLLLLMFQLGYKPKEWKAYKSRRDRAWASGNPALDYVGIGGGEFLDPKQWVR